MGPSDAPAYPAALEVFANEPIVHASNQSAHQDFDTRATLAVRVLTAAHSGSTDITTGRTVPLAPGVGLKLLHQAAR